MSSRLHLVRDSVLGLVVMVVVVVVGAVMAAPLPLDLLLGLLWAWVAYAWIQRYRRTRTPR